jgi:ketosteroid isomerase-like protein
VRGIAFVLIAATLVASCRPSHDAADPSSDVQTMLTRSAEAWNRGDLAAFMNDYARDSTTSFMTGRGPVFGWQTLYDIYQRNYFAPGRSRDSLSFEQVYARALGQEYALGTARFALHRGDSVVASGPFTLVLRRDADRWHIVHDHTSPDPRP